MMVRGGCQDRYLEMVLYSAAGSRRYMAAANDNRVKPAAHAEGEERMFLHAHLLHKQFSCHSDRSRKISQSIHPRAWRKGGGLWNGATL
jgi:hypothetical protein